MKAGFLGGMRIVGGSRRSESIFYHVCRINVDHEGCSSKHRVTILMCALNCVEAENIAECHLDDLIRDNEEIYAGERSIRWLKGRLFGRHPHAGQAMASIRLWYRLRRENCGVVSAIARI